MTYFYAIAFMVVSSPVLLTILGLISGQLSKKGFMSDNATKARLLAIPMYLAQFAIPVIALAVLWYRVINFGYVNDAPGYVRIDLLLDIICAPYTLWFSVYALGGLLGFLTLPFSDPRGRMYTVAHTVN